MSCDKVTNLKLPNFKKVTYEDITESINQYLKATETRPTEPPVIKINIEKRTLINKKDGE